jgi:FMN phosphatase YigB (HAD superfamily)
VTVKAVVFDLGKVLVDFDYAIAFLALRADANAFGLPGVKIMRKDIDLAILEVKNLSSFTDYFVISSGNSDRQVQAIERDAVLMALAEAQKAQTMDERKAALGKLQKYIMDNALEVPIYELYWHAGALSSLKDIKTDATGFYYYFKDKQDLFKALVEREGDKVLARPGGRGEQGEGSTEADEGVLHDPLQGDRGPV